MKEFNKRIVALVIIVLGFIGLVKVFAATTPSFGTAATYGVLSSTFTSNVGNTSITGGNVGYTTLSGSGTISVSGSTSIPSPAQAGLDQATALTSLDSEGCTYTFGGGAIDLSTDVGHGPIGVYTPGVYCSSGAMDVGGPITLNGAGTYIFRPDGALTSTTGSVITLSGASACDVFWTPDQATTLAANTTFVGTVINASAITVGNSVSWTGRALVYAGTLTIDTSTITVPVCTSPATLRVIKQVVNNNGGTAISSNFNLHVKNSGVDVSGSPASGNSTGTLYNLVAGTYVVSEDNYAGYSKVFSGDCNASGSITLISGENKTCTVTNTYIPNPVRGSGSAIVPFIGILKIPNPLTLPNGSGSVTYNYTVWNVGGLEALINITVTDDKCSPLNFISGDINNNSKLDSEEIWRYSCSTTLSKSTTNTAIATGYSDDVYHNSTIASAIATVVVSTELPAPLISIIKIPNRLISFPFGGGDVLYTYTVKNPGVVAMSDVKITDDKCTPVQFISGDVNNNNLLDVNETFIYSCRMNIKVSTKNVATVTGKANGFTATAYAFADVLVDPVIPNIISTVTINGTVLPVSSFIPSFPNTGLAPEKRLFIFDIAVPAGILMLIYFSIFLIIKNQKHNN